MDTLLNFYYQRFSPSKRNDRDSRSPALFDAEFVKTSGIRLMVNDSV